MRDGWVSKLLKKGFKVLKDSSSSANSLHHFLSTHKRMKSIQTRTSRCQRAQILKLYTYFIYIIFGERLVPSLCSGEFALNLNDIRARIHGVL